MPLRTDRVQERGPHESHPVRKALPRSSPPGSGPGPTGRQTSHQVLPSPSPARRPGPPRFCGKDRPGGESRHRTRGPPGQGGSSALAPAQQGPLPGGCILVVSHVSALEVGSQSGVQTERAVEWMVLLTGAWTRTHGSPCADPQVRHTFCSDLRLRGRAGAALPGGGSALARAKPAL